MRSRWNWCVVVGILGLASGCVERRFVIDSNPPAAKVYVNGEPIGFTPVDLPFTYYGTYNVTLERDGFQTQTFPWRVRAPWYAYPPFDFIVENLYPLKVRDIRRQQFEMSRVPQPQVEELRQQAEQLRERGHNLPEPQYPVEERNPPARQ
jgi:hypothetical protein